MKCIAAFPLSIDPTALAQDLGRREDITLLKLSNERRHYSAKFNVIILCATTLCDLIKQFLIVHLTPMVGRTVNVIMLSK